nr:ST.7 [Starmerella bombicola]
MGASSEGMSYKDLSRLTLEAVLQTVMVCVIGYWAAHQGYLNRSAQKVISNLNVMVFTPCLVFSKIASRLSVAALIDISIIPVIFLVSTGISYLCGRVCGKFFKFNERETNFVTAMAVFGNSNSVPVSLFLNLAASLPALQWPDIPNDNADNVASRGLLYLLIFQQLGQMLRWSWGFNTLLAPATLPTSTDPSSNSNSQLELGSANAEGTAQSQYADTNAGSDTQKRKLLSLVISEIKSFMNPPLWAMLAAIVVASVGPLKNALYGDEETFVHKTIGLGIQQVGSVAVPLILVVLGSNLAPPAADEMHFNQKSPNYSKMIFASLVSRMILPSLILLPIFALTVRYIGISILDDPAFLVACFILTASPPAIQLSQICQLNQVFEPEMAGVLFWGYLVLSLPSAIIIVVVALEVLDWTKLSVESVTAAQNLTSEAATKVVRYMS